MRDLELSRPSMAHRLAARPAPRRKKYKLPEAYLIEAVFVLLFDAIFWSAEVRSPSALGLTGALVFALFGALLLFQAYVVRLREKPKPEPDSSELNQASDV
jgi:hypothetical protein